MKQYIHYLFILFFCSNIALDANAQLEFDLKKNEFNNYSFKPNDRIVLVKNINPLLYKINLTANSKVYSANSPISTPEVPDFDISFLPTAMEGYGVFSDQSTLSKDQKTLVDYLLEFELIKSEYELDPKRLQTLLGNVDKLIKKLSKDTSGILESLKMLKSNIVNFKYFTNQSFHINTDSADAMDVSIEVIRKSLTDKEKSDTTLSVHRLYKKKYWSFSVSAGFFGSKFKQKSFEWGDASEIDEAITDIDSQSIFRIIETEEEQFTIGVNTLTHMMYNWKPSFSTGFHFGLGVSYIDRVIPQFQYGLSFGFLKGKRMIINIGGNASYQKYDLDASINRSALYGNSARNSLNLGDEIKKRFQHSIGTISITYQIL